MEKPLMHSKDMVASNIEAIATLFPNCVTERKDANGKITQGIDFEKLQQELSNDIIERGEERYQFTWPGKMAAIREANTPTNSALRPDVDGSEDFWNTKNLYIEGDNLEVLKLLQEDYLGKVKMIYIDPPYNTGNDFVYNDDFAESSADFSAKAGMYDEDGNMLLQNYEKNSESNGRFHTDWLNMMYPRLKVARNFLTEDGVIFINIGQQEVVNLEKCCNEIFGECNKISIVGRLMKTGGGKGQYFSPNLEYILIYARNIEYAKYFREPISEEIIKKLYTSIETRGPRQGEKYRPFGLYQSSLDPLRGCTNQRYYIEAPDGTLLIPPGITMPLEDREGAMIAPKSSDDKVWRWSRDRYLEEKAKGNIEFKKSDGVLIQSDGTPAKWNVYSKIWLSDRQNEGMVPVDIISKWENRHATKELKELNIPFDFAKPKELISYLMGIMGFQNEDIILDFFSGSATTAHAMLKLNAEDNANRRFIMVQLPELTEENSEAYKAGYRNICEIGKERIRRAGEKIKAENPNAANLDTGFRVLKLADSNMKQVYYTPNDTKLQMERTLFDTASNIKDDRTDLDLLFQVMLEKDVTLDAPIRKEKIMGHDVYFVDDTYLVATFGEKLPEALIKELAKMQPFNFVMANRGLSDDSMADNFEQIFKAYSPDTNCMIL